jgi:hypothetical protein
MTKKTFILFFTMIIAFGWLLGLVYRDVEILQERVAALEVKQKQIFVMTAEAYPKRFVIAYPIDRKKKTE